MHDVKNRRATVFRANEEAASGREWAIDYYNHGSKEPAKRRAVASYIDTLIERHGPVVEGYPCWHPFTAVSNSETLTGRHPHTEPQGFEGLDHTIYFRDAFITASYADPERIVKSALSKESDYIDAEILDVELYYYGAKPVLVTCSRVTKEADGTIAKRFALGSMLTAELPGWKWATCGESWEDMRRYLLGTPCGSRSSLFVNQETGKALREVHELLNRHELFGPLRS